MTARADPSDSERSSAAVTTAVRAAARFDRGMVSFDAGLLAAIPVMAVLGGGIAFGDPVAGVLSITPHIAGDSPLGHARAAELAAEQPARWCAGEELHNVVRDGSR